MFEREATLPVVATRAAVLPNGRVVLVVTQGDVQVWDRTQGRVLTLEHSRYVAELGVLPNGSVVGGGGHRRDSLELGHWDSTTGRRMHSLLGHSNGVACFAVRPDGILVAGDAGGALKLWDLDEGRCIETIVAHEDTTFGAQCVAALQDGRVASGGGTNSTASLNIWDVSTGLLQALTGHTKRVYCVDVLSDGRLVSAGYDSTIKLWSATEGSCLMSISAHDNEGIYCLVALPEDRVATGSWDGTVKCHDTHQGRCIDTIRPSHAFTLHRALVTSVAALPGGRLICTSAGLVTVWSEPQRELAKTTAKQVARQRACDDVAKHVAKYL